MSYLNMMRYYIIDAFTSQPFGGNPAGVVLLDGDTFPNEELMLKVAAELRYSETAFVRILSQKEYHVRYFTPKAEVELCGHATIATFSLLYQLRRAEGKCLCHTLAGDLRIEVGEKVLMQMATPRIVGTISDTEEIYRAIGVTDYQPTLPVQIAYSGLPDIMIPLRDVAMLQALKTDMDAITAITRKYEAVSFHVFAIAGDGHTAHVRNFAPLYDIPEESATGTANAALTHYLQQNGRIPSTGDFSFLQGEAMGRPSVVATRIAADGTIYVGGTATIVAEGRMRIFAPKNVQPMIIRLEQSKDYREVENLTREAFWNVYRPGCTEHYVLNQYRTNPDFIPELDFVMEEDDKTIGHVMFSKAELVLEDGSRKSSWTFGPISIHPDYKRKGYGLKLLQYALEKAREIGIGFLCMEGNIEFYKHAGFDLASKMNIHYHAEPKEAEVPFFLAQELIPGWLQANGITEATYCPPKGYFVADETPESFEAYEATFPKKEKAFQESQLPQFCQSCGMPLSRIEDCGTNADGSTNFDYCQYCYKDGKFLQECTMDEMIEHCSQFVDEVNKQMMRGFFPMLKRWRK